MNAYNTEEEQVEALKAWWKENGKSVIAGVVLGATILVGGRMWFSYQQGQAETASNQYQALIAALEQDDTSRVLERGSTLVGQYANTPYAALASLAMAKIKLEEGQHEAARSHLQWVIAHAGQAELEHIARLRLAKVLIADGEQAQALTLLNSVEPGEFGPAYKELKGDIFAAQGNAAAARQAYEEALAGLPAAADRNYLQLKLNDLGTKDDS